MIIGKKQQVENDSALDATLLKINCNSFQLESIDV